jgi:hypothetical protein
MNIHKGSATSYEILSEAKDDRAAAQPITIADGTSFVDVHYRAPGTFNLLA